MMKGTNHTQNILSNNITKKLQGVFPRIFRYFRQGYVGDGWVGVDNEEAQFFMNTL